MGRITQSDGSERATAPFEAPQSRIRFVFIALALVIIVLRVLL